MMDFRTLRPKCALLAPVCPLVLGAAGNVAADTINVGWDPSGSTVGYKVHVGVQSGSYTQHVDAGTSTTFAFTAATAGQRYCFAVSAYTLSSRVDGPNSSEVCRYSNAPPTLVNPGTRTSTVGQPTSLQLQGTDPASQPLTYSATGLPPGLSVMSSTGYISGTGTTAGTYSVTARASDGVLSTSQTFSWTMTARSCGGSTTPPRTGGTDTTRPTVTISSPTSASTYAINASSLAPTTGSTYLTTQSTINLSGSAADNRGVAQVAWMNSAGGNGVANGTTSWAITNLRLQSGTNVISVTALDAAGNAATATLTVTRSTTPPPPTLSVERLGSSSMWLSWTYTSWPSVDVYRNGFKVKTSSNDGSTNDNVDRRGNYTYKVCARIDDGVLELREYL